MWKMQSKKANMIGESGERGKICKVLSLCPSLIFLAIYKSKKLD